MVRCSGVLLVGLRCGCNCCTRVHTCRCQQPQRTARTWGPPPPPQFAALVRNSLCSSLQGHIKAVIAKKINEAVDEVLLDNREREARMAKEREKRQQAKEQERAK